MPDSSRRRVDLPAPLWPTSARRSPSETRRSMLRSASMTTTLRSLAATLPPTTPRTVCFSDRDLASKIGKSTLASRTSMLTMVASSSDPVRDATAVAAHDQQRQGPADHGDPDDDEPGVPLLVLAQQRPADELHEVEQGVELDQPCPPGDGRVVQQDVVHPDDRRQEEQQLDDALGHRRQVAEAGADDADEQRHPHAVDHEQAERREDRQVGPPQRLREEDEHDGVDDHVVGEE